MTGNFAEKAMQGHKTQEREREKGNNSEILE
jgi:hypothetical protein